MFRADRIPFDLSQIPSYLERTLGAIAKEINGYEIKDIIPVWTGGTTNPAIGNGTLSLRYFLQNDYCELWLAVLMGSTTTFGTGEWRFQLPVPAKVRKQFGTAYMLDNGANNYVGVCEAGTNGILRIISHLSATIVANNAPFTWANGDELHAHIRYLR